MVLVRYFVSLSCAVLGSIVGIVILTNMKNPTVGTVKMDSVQSNTLRSDVPSVSIPAALSTPYENIGASDVASLVYNITQLLSSLDDNAMEPEQLSSVYGSLTYVENVLKEYATLSILLNNVNEPVVSNNVDAVKDDLIAKQFNDRSLHIGKLYK